jgi:hypothetical protein
MLTEVFGGFPSVPEGKFWKSTSIMPQSIPSKSLPVHYLPFVLPFDVIQFNF